MKMESVNLPPSKEVKRMTRIDYAIERIRPNNEQFEGRKVTESMLATAQQEATLFRHFFRILSPEHPTAIEARKRMLEAGEVLGLDLSDFECLIYDSPLLDAHVTPYAKEVRLSTGLLKTLDYNAEEASAVIGHEIGHVFLSHQDNKDEALHGEVGMSDPLADRTMSYEEEYQADRASAIIQHRLGRRTSALRTALEKIEAETAKLTKHIGDQLALEWIFSTHPHTTRRSSSLRRLERNLPVDPKVDELLNLIKPADTASIQRNKDLDKRNMEFDSQEKIYDVFFQGENEKDSGILHSQIKNFHPLDTPLEYLPDDVNAFEDDPKIIQDWWDQAREMNLDEDGREDLDTDISEYTTEAVKRLLRNFSPIDFAMMPYGHNDPSTTVQDAYNNQQNAQAHLLGGLMIDPSISELCSKLINAWFEKEQNLSTKEGVREILEFLREFRMKQGLFLPSGNGKIIDVCAKLFDQADENEKRELVKLYDEYAAELQAGDLGASYRDYFKLRISPIRDWADEVGGFTHQSFYFNKKKRQDRHRKAVNTAEAKQLSEQETILPEDARSFFHAHLELYNRKSLSTFVASKGKALADMYAHPQKYADDVFFQRIRESDPTIAVHLMSEDEFLENYFGTKREDYVQVPYADLEQYEEKYIYAHTIMKKTDYSEALEKLGTMREKAAYLTDIFPVVCGRRDQILVNMLGWPELITVEDLKPVREAINSEEDLQLLQLLQYEFSHPMLRLACANRLWELYQDAPEKFFESTSENSLELIKEQLPKELHVEKLLAILLAYQDPSYLRDELLTPFIDKAPNEELTLLIASYLTEPPPGIVQRRSVERVASAEGIIDIMKQLPLIDKQEIILYLLGHRDFYSGIDSRFIGTRQGDEDQRRSDMIYYGRDLVEASYGTDEPRSIYDDDPSSLERYFVETPDALIQLAKSSGISIDLMIEEERALTTRKEQLDLLSQVFNGPDGVMSAIDSDKFLQKIAEIIAAQGKFTQQSSEEERQAVSNLLGFSLQKCPRDKLPSLFLNLWYLSQNEGGTLPELTAKLFQEYGPAFVKAGQYLGTQSASLPPEWIDAFRKMSDQNEASDKTLLYEYEYAAYSGDSPFSGLGMKLGEGSMAAVYKGELGSGETVVAKVLHPFIRTELNDDITFLGEIVQFVNANSEQYGDVQLPGNLGDVSRELMMEESDLLNEAKNAAELGALVSKDGQIAFSVPQAIDEHSSSNFLVSEFIEGVAIDDDSGMEELGINPKEIKSATAIELMKQVFTHGVYHADPNPGNIQVERTPNGEVTVHLYDTGHLGRIPAEERTFLKFFILTLESGGSTDLISEGLTTMVEIPEGVERNEVKLKIQEWLSNESIDQLSGAQKFQQLFTKSLDFFAKEKLVFKNQWVILMRSIGLAQPLLKELSEEQIANELIPILTT